MGVPQDMTNYFRGSSTENALGKIDLRGQVGIVLKCISKITFDGQTNKYE